MTKKKKYIVPVPYAITSKEWKEIHTEKENKRIAKETLILEKRNARLMKKIENENKRKSKGNKNIIKKNKSRLFRR